MQEVVARPENGIAKKLFFALAIRPGTCYNNKVRINRADPFAVWAAVYMTEDPVRILPGHTVPQCTFQASYISFPDSGQAGCTAFPTVCGGLVPAQAGPHGAGWFPEMYNRKFLKRPDRGLQVRLPEERIQL